MVLKAMTMETGGKKNGINMAFSKRLEMILVFFAVYNAGKMAIRKEKTDDKKA